MTVSLPGVDQIGVFLAFIRIRAHSQNAVLALQRHRDVGRHVVWHQRRQPDAEIDVLSVAQLLRDACGELRSR